MAKDIEIPNLFNPMMLWTDLGLRALERTLSSSQNIGDGIDRLSRPGASAEATETVVAPATISEEPPPTWPAFPDLNLFLQMQRSTFDLMTQGWQQWMNTLGTLASLGAGRSFAETARQNPMLNAMQEMLLRNADEAAARAQPKASSRPPAGQQRERNPDKMEHAYGVAETKRRSRTGRAKPKARSRNS